MNLWPTPAGDAIMLHGCVGGLQRDESGALTPGVLVTADGVVPLWVKLSLRAALVPLLAGNGRVRIVGALVQHPGTELMLTVYSADRVTS